MSWATISMLPFKEEPAQEFNFISPHLQNSLTPEWSWEATLKHVKKLLLQKIQGRSQILEGVVVWWTSLCSIMCSMRARRFEGAGTRKPDNQGQQSRRLQQQSRRFWAQVAGSWALAKLLKSLKEAEMLGYLRGHVVKVSPGAALGCSSVAANTSPQSASSLFCFQLQTTQQKSFSSFFYRSPIFFARENSLYSEFNCLTSLLFFLLSADPMERTRLRAFGQRFQAWILVPSLLPSVTPPPTCCTSLQSHLPYTGCCVITHGC